MASVGEERRAIDPGEVSAFTHKSGITSVVEDLSTTYGLVSKITCCLELFSNMFKMHVTNVGTALINEAEDSASNKEAAALLLFIGSDWLERIKVFLPLVEAADMDIYTCQQLVVECVEQLSRMLKISERKLSAVIASGRKRKRSEDLRDNMQLSRPVERIVHQRDLSSSNRAGVQYDTERSIKFGTRSRMDAPDWTCLRCKCNNRSRRFIIADLPKFQCSNPRCGGLLNEDYEFSFTMANVLVNGSCPIGNIKDQGETKECTFYATCTALEINERMTKILQGEALDGKNGEGPILDTSKLLKTYEKMMKIHRINMYDSKYKKYNYTTLMTLCDIATHHGIEYLQEKDHKTKEQSKSKKYMAKGKRKFEAGFDQISELLASGIPLIAVIPAGKKFDELKNGQIYKAPKLTSENKKKKNVVLHAIVLIGSGRRRGCNYYHFLNSYGENFCLRDRRKRLGFQSLVRGGRCGGKVKKFFGGFGKVRATDVLLETVQFFRFKNLKYPTTVPWILPHKNMSTGKVPE